MGSAAGKNGLALIRIDRVADALDAGVHAHVRRAWPSGSPIPIDLATEPKQTVA